MAEVEGDTPGQLLALDGMALAALQLNKYAEALPQLERACALAAGLGDAECLSLLQEKVAQCQADLRGEKRTPHFPSPAGIAAR